MQDLSFPHGRFASRANTLSGVYRRKIGELTVSFSTMHIGSTSMALRARRCAEMMGGRSGSHSRWRSSVTVRDGNVCLFTNTARSHIGPPSHLPTFLPTPAHFRPLSRVTSLSSRSSRRRATERRTSLGNSRAIDRARRWTISEISSEVSRMSRKLIKIIRARDKRALFTREYSVNFAINLAMPKEQKRASALLYSAL